MLQVHIGDTAFEYLEAIETEEYYNGASRRTITFTCNSNVIPLDTLNSLLTEENLKHIELENTDIGLTNEYDGYVLKLECGIKSMEIEKETPEVPAKYEDRLIFKIGRRTYIEQALADLGIKA